jgi:hypothetical protein
MGELEDDVTDPVKQASQTLKDAHNNGYAIFTLNGQSSEYVIDIDNYSQWEVQQLIGLMGMAEVEMLSDVGGEEDE